MPRLVDYHCEKCKKIEKDVYYHKPEDVKDEIKCECGAKAERMFGCAHFYIDDWTPMLCDAQRDRDHFESKPIVNGRYVSRRATYQRDQARKDIPMNLPEV